MPAYSVRNGDLVMEHGVHQEMGWERSTDTSQMAVLIYADEVKNPALEASANFADGDGPASRAMLFDPQSGLLRTAGPDYSSAGLEASVQRSLPGKT